MKRKTIVWRDSYKDIDYEITNFNMKGYRDNCWTYYITLAIEQFEECIRAKLKTNVYYTGFGSRISSAYDSPLHDIFFHGGITYYEDVSTKDYPFSLIKVGCDFQHYWDEDKYYSLEDVEADVKKTIDELLTTFKIKTLSNLWEEFRKRFPQDLKHRFDINGKPVEVSK